MVEPELFYMPVKKRMPSTPLTLRIRIRLYNTLNIETMEYSNTGDSNLYVNGNIIVWDKNMNIIFNSKKDYVWNKDGSYFFEIPNLEQGRYYVKVISASGGGVVDGKLHSIELKESLNNELNIYLKYYWNTITGKINEKYMPEVYITNYTTDSGIKDFSITGGVDRFEIFDDVVKKTIAVLPQKEKFSNLHRIGYKSQTYGDFGISIFVNGASCNSYSFNYYYKSKSMNISNGYGYYYNHYYNGSFSRKLVPDTIITCSTDKNEETENETSVNDIKVFKTYTSYSSFNEISSSPRGSEIRIFENRKTYQQYGEEEFLKEDEDFTTGGYSNFPDNTHSVSGMLDALSYYDYYNFFETNEIDNNFFYYGNYFIVQSTRTKNYGTVDSLSQYNRDIENTEIVFKKSCRPYNISKYYFSQGITTDKLMINGLYSKSLNIIIPSDGSIITEGARNYFYGYKKFNETLNDESVIHFVNDKLTSFSDDYNNY